MPLEDTIAVMQRELDSIDMKEIILAVATDRDVKKDIHKLLIEHFKERADSGEQFKITKRQLGLMIVLEGLIVMASARESESEQTRESNFWKN